MIKMNRFTTLVIIALASGSAGCSGCDATDDGFTRKNNKVDDPAAPKCEDVGTKYKGFAGTELTEKRVNAAIGTDRARIKPYSALKGEYERTIGVAPASLQQAGASFGNPPERFSSEPHASAIQVYSAFRVAFDGCLTYTEAPAEYANAPTPESAAQNCASMARKFWSRTATKEEIDSCAQVALTDSASEPTPRRRWAYTCAALLSSAGFLTY